jgi:uncharacterized protein with gpF-like domain
MTKYIELGAIRPSFALELSYRNKLQRLIDAMIRNVISEVKSKYENKEAVIAQDSVALTFENLINKLLKPWTKVFASSAGLFAPDFINAIDKHNKLQMKSSLDKLSEKLTVNFSKESKKSLQVNESLIQEQINLITNIPQEFEKKLSDVVFTSISRGRDFKYLESELQNIADITEKRAKFIAHNQINYATSMINKTRQQELGFTKSKWKHSHASKVPRQSHLKANNTIYNTAEGCKIDDEYIYPAEKIGCNCYSVVVVEV